MIKKILLVLLLFSAVSLNSYGSTTYNYRRTVTVPYVQVPNTDETNFPVYVTFSDPGLKTAINGGHVQNSAGADIAFFGDTSLTKVLPFELVSYDGAAGTLTAVVRYPQLSHNTDTVFYMGYGMSGTTSQATPTAVWQQYLGVYHLDENAATKSILNSATGDVAGKSVSNTAAMSRAGKLGRGLKLNGSSDMLDLGAYSSLDEAGKATFSGWINFASFADYTSIFSKMDSNNAGYLLGLASSDFGSSSTDWLTTVRAKNGVASYTTGYGLQPGIWYYFTTVFADGNLDLYINGNKVALSNFGGVNNVIPTVSADLTISSGLNATVDELRVSDHTYTQDWITTEYNNMSNPNAFAVLGSEAAFVPPPPAQMLDVSILGITPTQAILSYVAPDSNACSVAVSTSPDTNEFTAVFTSLVHDVDPSLFPGADLDTKSGNLVNGKQRTVVVGHRGVGDGVDGNIYSLALQAATLHYYRIDCANGAYVGAGSFMTTDIPLGDSAPDVIPYDANGFGGYGWPTVNFADQSAKYVDPQTGALLQRLTGAGDQLYSQFPNQRLNAPLDLSGGSWTNLNNLGESVDGSVAGYSGPGGPSNAIFLPFAFTGLGRYSYNSNNYTALDDVRLHLHASGDPVMACLSSDDGQTCLGSPIQLSLPTTAAGDAAGPSNYPAPLFQGWGNARVTSDMLTNNFGINATLTGNQLVWNSGSDATGQSVYFPVTTLKPGTVFYLGGNYFHIASIQDQQHLTTVESVSSPITGGTVYFAGFGVKLWKQPGGTGSVSIDSAFVDLSLSNTFGTEDQGFGATGCSGDVTVSYAADGVTPITPVTGYMCTFVSSYGSLVWKLMIPSTGEVRKISNLNNLSPGGGSAPTNFYAYNSDSGLIKFCSYNVDDPVNGRFKAWFDNFNSSSNNPAISCQDLSSQYTVTQEIQMAHPEIDLSYYGAPNFQGDSYPYFVFLMRPSQNQAYWACVIDVSQPIGAAQAQNCHNSWGTYPIRWAASHGGEFAAGANIESYIMVPMNQPNQQGVGQYTLSINTVYNNGGSTAVSNSFFDPKTCQALGVTDSRWVAAGATGRNCIKINVVTEPVNTNPNLNDIKPLGNFPVGSKPGPWPHNSAACNGDGATNNCWGYLQAMMEGDYIGDTASGSSEPFLIAKKTVLANGTIDLVLARNMNPFYLRGGNASPENHASGWTPWMQVPNGGGTSGVFYSAFGKPFGPTTTVADNPTLFQAHTIDWGNAFGNGIHITAQAWLNWPTALGGYGSGYGVRYGQTPGIYSQGFLYGVQANYGFNGSFRGLTIGQIQSHPGGGTYAAPQRESTWAVDGRPLGGAAGGSTYLWNHTYTKISGTVNTYKISLPSNGDGTTLSFANWDAGLDIKNRAVFAWAGYHLLKDISGPNSKISDSTPWSFCIALQANECVTGSNPKDQYVSVPYANTSGSCLIDGTQLTPCISTVGPQVGAYTQFDVSKSDPFGLRWRKLTMAFGGPGRTDNFANMHAFATGDWTVTAGKWLDGRRSDVIGVKLPPWPNEDSIVRNTFVKIPVLLSGQSGTFVRARFGYSPKLFCSSRQEQCSTAVSNSDPFAFLSEQQTWTPCSGTNGCKVDIPAQSSRVLYYVVDRKDAVGNISSTPMMLIAVD